VIEMEYHPDADERTWGGNIKKSKGEFIFLLSDLGEITSEGERGYICTHCGKEITKAHHIKPERYRIVYNGQTFYLERHICDDCMRVAKRKIVIKMTARTQRKRR